MAGQKEQYKTLEAKLSRKEDNFYRFRAPWWHKNSTQGKKQKKT